MLIDHLSFCAVTLLIAAIITLFLKFKTKSNSQSPPGPRGLRAVWEILQGMWHETLVHQAEAWRHRYGELVLCRSSMGDIVFINSARLVRKLYASKDLQQFTNNRPDTFLAWYGFYNYRDIATSSVQFRKEWTKSRKVFHQALKFYGDGVDRMDSVMQSELRRLVTELEQREGQDTDVHTIVSDSVLRAMLTLVMGECPEQTLVLLAEQVNDLTNKMRNPITNLALTSCPWLRFLPFLHYRKLCKDFIKRRDEFLKQTFTKAKETFVKDQSRGIIDMLLHEQAKEENQWLTDDDIRAIILNTMSGGHITSRQVLKSILFYLIHNPEITLRMQKEIDDRLGGRTPQIQDRSDLPFTEAVINETLRIVSPVPIGIPHLVGKDLTVDGYTVRKGTQMFANSLGFQNDPEVFPDPKEFRPERFLDDTGHLLQANHPLRQKVLPFGVGKRGCPGESFARSRLFLFITTLLQHFDVLPPENHPTVTSSIEYKGIVPEAQPFHAIFRQRVL